MPMIDQMFPRRFATGADLNGKPVSVTIDRVVVERVRPPGAPETEKYVMYPKSARKGVVLCATLARQIAAAVGSEDTDDWLGHKVTLYPEPMMVAGVPRVAIRARPMPTNGGNGND